MTTAPTVLKNLYGKHALKLKVHIYTLDRKKVLGRADYGAPPPPPPPMTFDAVNQIKKFLMF